MVSAYDTLARRTRCGGECSNTTRSIGGKQAYSEKEGRRVSGGSCNNGWRDAVRQIHRQWLRQPLREIVIATNKHLTKQADGRKADENCGNTGGASYLHGTWYDVNLDNAAPIILECSGNVCADFRGVSALLCVCQWCALWNRQHADMLTVS